MNISTHNLFKSLILKYKSASMPAKAALWFTFAAFMQKGIAFISTPIFTRILTTEQYGIVSVFNTWEQLIAIFCTFNLYYGSFNNGMRDYKSRRNEYVAAIQGLITFISIVWLMIYIIDRTFWNSILDMESYLVYFMFLQIVMSSALLLWSAKERYEFRYKKLVIITMTNSFLSTFLPVLAIFLSPSEKGAETRIITQCLSVAVVCGLLYCINFSKGKIFYSREIWRSAFLFNLPLLPHYLSTMILNQSDRIMISKMVGNSEAAIYSVAYSFASVLSILSNSINQSFGPWIYSVIENKAYDKVYKIGNLIFSLIGLILMILTVFAPECIYIFAGSQYSDAIKVIPPVAASLYFLFMYHIFANVEFYYKKNMFITYASMIGAVLNIILNYIGIKKYGFVAAGYTTLICYIIFGVSHFYFMKKICKKEIPDANLFDSRTIFTIALILVMFSIIMSLLYSLRCVRYVILLGLIICLLCVSLKKKYVSHYFMFKDAEKC